MSDTVCTYAIYQNESIRNIMFGLYIVLYIETRSLTVQYHLNIFIFHVKIILVLSSFYSFPLPSSPLL